MWFDSHLSDTQRYVWGLFNLLSILGFSVLHCLVGPLGIFVILNGADLSLAYSSKTSKTIILHQSYQSGYILIHLPCKKDPYTDRATLFLPKLKGGLQGCYVSKPKCANMYN